VRFRRFCSSPSLLRPVLTFPIFVELHVTTSHPPTRTQLPLHSPRHLPAPFLPRRPPHLAFNRRSTAQLRTRHSRIDIRTLQSPHRRSEGRRGRSATSRLCLRSRKKPVFFRRPRPPSLSRFVKAIRRIRRARCRKAQERKQTRGICASLVRLSLVPLRHPTLFARLLRLQFRLDGQIELFQHSSTSSRRARRRPTLSLSSPLSRIPCRDERRSLPTSPRTSTASTVSHTTPRPSLSPLGGSRNKPEFAAVGGEEGVGIE
jgi:hypothetical protein